MSTPIYPQRWPLEIGPVGESFDLWIDLMEGKNQMALVGRSSNFEKAVGPLLDGFLEDHTVNLVRGKTTVSCLQPGSGIKGHHVDRGAAPYDDGACENRYHVPLRTNDDAVFLVEGSAYRMPEGSIYLVNPLVPHTAYNGGDRPRVHLFFNALEKGNS